MSFGVKERVRQNYSENYFNVGIIAVEISRVGPTTTSLGNIMASDFYSYSILRTIVLVPPTPLSPELLRSLVSTMAAAGSSALPSPISGRRPN